MALRNYQLALKQGAYDAWASGARNVLLQSATGSGKTVVKASVVEDINDAACCIAHRRELVSQISVALAREGVRHRVIAPHPVVKFCAQLHIGQLGRSLVDQRSQVGVAGVDTLIRPSHELDLWARRCALVVQDEAHHLLADNKWGRAWAKFPNAKGLGVTATPIRTDGKGLGRHAQGVMDVLIEGPTPRELIRQGYLCDYRIIGARHHLEGLVVGPSGELTGASVDEVMRNSRVVGDVVPTWFGHAYGLRTVVFAHNLEAAKELADEFIATGVAAAVVSSKNTDAERVGLVRRFETGQLTVLVNVDLFGEGFDLPALECVVMARPTASLGLYMQQFGRVLRIISGKTHGLVIDHVGNVLRHGLPDAPRHWTLDARPKRQSEGPTDAIPLRTCSNVECLGVYERVYKVCPYCKQEHVPADRSGPEHVDGDLFELDAATLARMRGDADRYAMTPEQAGAEVRDKHGPPIAIAVAAKRHTQWQHAQTRLRAAIEQWCGYRRAEGRDDATICRLFYFVFGVDILTAQGLRKIEEVDRLTALIESAYTSRY